MDTNATKPSNASEYLTLTIAGQNFGIPVLKVQDVLREQNVTHIPLAPPEVSGSLNLRGRIVTVINVRKRLNLPPRENNSSQMGVVIELDGELYSLLIDQVKDVLLLSDNDFEKNPATLDPLWRDISQGIFRLEDDLLVILDVENLLGTIGVKKESA